MTVVIRAGEASLADWRAIWRGAPVAVDPSHHAGVAASAAAVERIVARGEPVYGINTGFGKLAGVRIEAADLAAASAQHRAVARGRGRRTRLGRDDAAHDGAEARQPRPGRLGRPAAHAWPHRGDAGSRRHAGRPGARVGRRVGRSRAARPYGGGDDRRRRRTPRRSYRARRRRARRGRPRADRASAQGRAGAAQRHPVLDRQCSDRPVRGRNAVPLRFGDGGIVDRRRARIGYAVRPPHPCAEAPSRPDRGRRRLYAPCSREAPFALRISPATNGSRTPIACAASRR